MVVFLLIVVTQSVLLPTAVAEIEVTETSDKVEGQHAV